ncbi:MAG: hypothetical protein LBI70_00055 [Rickettsiales bacterium]|jgi:hypothetical protein|nr:hypothetical protein [Rickettsiales bacterium]
MEEKRKHACSNGCTYKGDFREGKIDGNGKSIYLDGDIYKENFKDNVEFTAFGHCQWGVNSLACPSGPMENDLHPNLE